MVKNKRSATPADAIGLMKKRAKTEEVQEQKAAPPMPLTDTLEESQDWSLMGKYAYFGADPSTKKFRVKGWLKVKDFKHWSVENPWCTARVFISPTVAQAFGRVKTYLEGKLRNLKESSKSFGTPYFQATDFNFKCPVENDMISFRFNKNTLHAVEYDAEADMSVPGRLVPQDELLVTMENKDVLLADFEIEVFVMKARARVSTETTCGFVVQMQQLFLKPADETTDDDEVVFVSYTAADYM